MKTRNTKTEVKKSCRNCAIIEVDPENENAGICPIRERGERYIHNLDYEDLTCQKFTHIEQKNERAA